MQIIEIVIAFFIIRFLITLIDSIFTVNKVRQNIVRNFNQQSNQQSNNFQKNSTPASKKEEINKIDYIDYEEVKSEFKNP